MDDSDGICNKLIENLLLIKNAFLKVQQQVDQDSAPLIMGQELVGPYAFSSEIPFERLRFDEFSLML